MQRCILIFLGMAEEDEHEDEEEFIIVVYQFSEVVGGAETKQ